MENKTVAIEELHEDPANARVHEKKNLDAIRNSLLTFGQVEPIIVQKSTMKVVGGNGRLRVMKDLAWKEVKAVILDIDDSQAAALGIALNRTAETARWDENTLTKLLIGLEADDELLLATGFLAEDLEQLKMSDVDDDDDLGFPDDDTSEIPMESVFEVIVECEDEAQQKELFDKLAGEGYRCRILSV